MSTAHFAAGRDGTRIYVRRREGPSPVTAILCDGIACDGFIWKYLWDDLAQQVSVAHWNYRGHGRSATPVDPTAVELAEHARDLDAVRRTLGDPDVVLFGHSMGCQVVLEHVRIRPEKIRGVVLVCGSSGRITHTFKGTNVMAQLLPGVIAKVEAFPEIARAIWSRVPPEIALQVALATGEVDKAAIRPEDLMPYMKHMVDIDVPMFLRMLHSAGEHSAADLLPQIAAHALVIAGDRDTFTPPRYAEEMAAAMPHSELLMVPGATHVVPLERKDLVAARVEKFLRERVLP
ncbi:Beta-ketoadipate enol-lactone hydrolase [Minicystis rosea]|nr:Beta-ketoadipate enol-lactone hydrolase [Minicystis rosea]